MAPNAECEDLYAAESKVKKEEDAEDPTIAAPWEHEYILSQIILFLIYWHISGFYGVYLCFTSAKWGTIFFMVFSYIFSGCGVTAGAHRLWTHKSFKAAKPLQVFLMIAQSWAFQKTLVFWIRIHRLHHKYSDTDADPHNSNRGFFFSHIGWLLVKPHPEVKKRIKTVDMSDIYSNPVVMFQKRHNKWLLPLVGIIIPTAIPWFLGETFSNSWHINATRHILSVNVALSVNSIAHRWGYRPYDKSMKACQSLLLFMTAGEGFHNYHHAFPWDYKASELGNNTCNLTTIFIDFCARMGWAYDLKTAPDEMVKQRAKRTGDGTDLWGRKLKNIQ